MASKLVTARTWEYKEEFFHFWTYIESKSYGFQTYHAIELALYHNLGRLPEPEATHEFC